MCPLAEIWHCIENKGRFSDGRISLNYFHGIKISTSHKSCKEHCEFQPLHQLKKVTNHNQDPCGVSPTLIPFFPPFDPHGKLLPGISINNKILRSSFFRRNAPSSMNFTQVRVWPALLLASSDLHYGKISIFQTKYLSLYWICFLKLHISIGPHPHPTYPAFNGFSISPPRCTHTHIHTHTPLLPLHIYMYFLTMLRGLWNLGSPTRHRTRAPCNGSTTESQPLDRQEIPSLFTLTSCSPRPKST